jgi:hypothetical protein
VEPFKDDASLDELREEIMRDLGHLVSTGVIDLKTLPLPDGGPARRMPARVVLTLLGGHRLRLWRPNSIVPLAI